MSLGFHFVGFHFKLGLLFAGLLFGFHFGFPLGLLFVGLLFGFRLGLLFGFHFGFRFNVYRFPCAPFLTTYKLASDRGLKGALQVDTLAIPPMTVTFPRASEKARRRLAA